MTTDIPVGTAFVVRECHEMRLWRVTELPDGRHGYTGVGRPLQPGEVVHRAVWIGDRLESRAQYTLGPGDAVWQDTGMRGTDFSKPPHPVTGYPEADHNIHVNRFEGGPRWLRDAV
jgi:hypothetical protein